MEDIINYLILGILQGIFEWIPISSEGVVALAANYLKVGVNPVNFALFLHIGTLAAALVFYWRDWRGVFLLRDWQLIKFLSIATAISLPIGFIVYKTIEETAVGTGLLAITGAGLLFTAYFQHKKTNLGLDKTRLAVIGGILQGVAVIPGFSRSGSTIFGLSLGNLAPKEILRLSYLMSVPAVAASSGYLMIFKSNGLSFDVWPGILASFVIGVATLEALTKLSEKTNFARFALIFALLCFIGAALEIWVK